MPNAYELFLKRFKEFTEIQKLAFKKVESGENCIITAPTGSGKTEAALIPILNKLSNSEDKSGIRLIYITPLRALNRDLIRRLEIICKDLGVSIGVRHGDTSQKERKSQLLNPPQFLITTPETLQNVLVSGLRKSLVNLEFLIVDEVHELYYNKRGAQLSIIIERIAELSKNFQRIGISATIGDMDEIGRYLFGNMPYKSIESIKTKDLKLTIEMPVKPKHTYEKFKKSFNLDEQALARMERIASLIKNSEAAIVFANTRQVVESLGSKLIQLNKTENFGAIGIHHSSLDRQERINTENMFKEGKYKAIIATSSLELGIDIGQVDLVVQYSSPRQVIRMIQRIGRSGHRAEQASKGTVIVAGILDAFESVAIAASAVNRQIEKQKMEENALDVLANQITSMSLEYRSIYVDKVYSIVKRASPYRNLGKDSFNKVLKFLAEGHLIDLHEESMRISSRSRDYFINNISVLPDIKHFFVKDYLSNRIISVLDERFVYSYVDENATFITKGLPWKVVSIEEDTIFVEPSTDLEAAVPDWEGEDIPVSRSIAEKAIGLLDKKTLEAEKKFIESETYNRLEEFDEEQAKFFAHNPKRVVIEDADDFAIIHVALGKLANEFLARALTALISAEVRNAVVRATPYAIFISYPNATKKPNMENVLSKFKNMSKEVLRSPGFIMDSELFRYKFVQSAKLFGVIEKKANVTKGSISRLISFYKDSPITEEVLRDLGKNYFDFGTVSDFIEGLKKGEIKIENMVYVNSPLANEILRSAYHYAEMLLPIMPTENEIQNFKERIQNKGVELICTYCGLEFAKNIDIDSNAQVLCLRCKSPLVATRKEEYVGVVGKRLKGEKLDKAEQKTYRNMINEASLVDAYADKALAALSIYGIGITTAGRLLKYIRRDSKQFLVDLIEARKTFIRTKKYWAGKKNT